MDTVIWILSGVMLILAIVLMCKKSLFLNGIGFSTLLLDIMLTYPVLKANGTIDYFTGEFAKIFS